MGLSNIKIKKKAPAKAVSGSSGASSPVKVTAGRKKATGGKLGTRNAGVRTNARGPDRDGRVLAKRAQAASAPSARAKGGDYSTRTRKGRRIR